MKNSVIKIAALFFLFSACKTSDDPQPSIGGKGGNGTIKVTPRHHGSPIDSCTIYIKYNATDEPANKQYDDSMKCVQVGGLPVAAFTGLKKGNYYLYGYGWDPTLTPPSAVKGAFAFNLSSETVQTIDLAVSED